MSCLRVEARIVHHFEFVTGELESWKLFDSGSKVLRCPECHLWRQDGTLDVTTELLIPFLDEGPSRFKARQCTFRQHHKCVGGEIVEQRCGGVEEQWKVVLDTRR